MFDHPYRLNPHLPKSLPSLIRYFIILSILYHRNHNLAHSLLKSIYLCLEYYHGDNFD